MGIAWNGSVGNLCCIRCDSDHGLSPPPRRRAGTGCNLAQPHVPGGEQSQTESPQEPPKSHGNWSESVWRWLGTEAGGRGLGLQQANAGVGGGGVHFLGKEGLRGRSTSEISELF